MILLVVKLELQEGKKKGFIDLTKELVKCSKQEEGCIEYNLYEDLDEPNTVAFIEKWKDQAAIDIHEKMDYFRNTMPKMKDFTVKPPVKNRYDVAK